jgi:hypothetical protein
VSDEAFAQLVYENNYPKWSYMFVKNDMNDQSVPAKWTSGGENPKRGKNKKFCGWAKEGLEQLNQNYLKVQQDRADDKKFDKMLLKYYQDNQKPNKRARKGEKENELAGFKLLNSLPLAGRNVQVEESDCDDSDIEKIAV